MYLSEKILKITLPDLIDYNNFRIAARRQSPIEMVFKVIFSLPPSPQKAKNGTPPDNPD
jgi:hypothetical protein